MTKYLPTDPRFPSSRLARITANIDRARRMRVRRHTLKIPAAFFRRVLDVAPGETVVGGYPTTGGATTMDPGDSTRQGYVSLGKGFLLPATAFDPATGAIVRTNDLLSPPAEPRVFHAISAVEPGEVGWFEADRGDVAVIEVAAGVLSGIELVAAQSPIGFGPFVRLFEAVPKDHLGHLLGPVMSGG